MRKILGLVVLVGLLVSCLIPAGKGRVDFKFSGVPKTDPVGKGLSVDSRVLAANAFVVIGKDGVTEIGTIKLDKARLLLAEIDLDVVDDAVGESDIEGPFVVDLLTGTTKPELKPIDIDAKLYDEIELELDVLEEDEKELDIVAEDDPLYTNSIHLQGTYTPTGSEMGIPLTMTTAEDYEFEIKKEGVDSKIAVGDQQEMDLFIVFEIAKWFNFASTDVNAIDLSSFNGARSIVLDNVAIGDSAKLRDAIEENIENSGEVDDDDDN